MLGLCLVGVHSPRKPVCEKFHVIPQCVEIEGLHKTWRGHGLTARWSRRGLTDITDAD
jgi:hypothetical protein